MKETGTPPAGTDSAGQYPAKHLFTLPRDPSAPQHARRALDGIKDLLGPHRSDVEMLATELVTMRLDSMAPQGRGWIALGVELSARSITLEVSNDSSYPGRVQTLFDGRNDRLKLIEALAASWGVVQSTDLRMWCRVERAR